MSDTFADIPEGTPVAKPPRPKRVERRKPAGPDAVCLSRWLYNHNPFYVVSALLVFWGVWRSAAKDPDLVEAGAVAMFLAAYTLLLALTACLIVRLGRVWEDARSLLLLCVLMFLAISVSSDAVLNAEEQPGATFVLSGFVFAVGLSEITLRALPLRLPLLYRGPYYLLLGLFFLYPLAMRPLLREPPGPALYWALFGFSTAAGGVFLTLIPALRRGAAHVNQPGHPWRWPIYPWVLFGMLGVCVCLRSFYLCVSFHPVLGNESIFGPYFLAPFLLAVSVLLIEAAVLTKSTGVQRAALVLPPLIVGLCLTGHHTDAVYTEFLRRFVETFHAAPAFCAALAAIALYGYAFARRLPGAEGAFTLAVAALAFVPPWAIELESLGPWTARPLYAIGLAHGAAGVARGGSARFMLGACAVLLGFSLDPSIEMLDFAREIIAWHGLVLALLIAGAGFHDALKPAWRGLGAILMYGLALAMTLSDPHAISELPPAAMLIYPLVLMVAMVAYGRLTRSGVFYFAATAAAFAWIAVWAGAGYRIVRGRIFGIDQITIGVAFFLLAVLLSLIKAGWRPWRRVALPTVETQPSPATD